MPPSEALESRESLAQARFAATPCALLLANTWVATTTASWTLCTLAITSAPSSANMGLNSSCIVWQRLVIFATTTVTVPDTRSPNAALLHALRRGARLPARAQRLGHPSTGGRGHLWDLQNMT